MSIRKINNNTPMNNNKGEKINYSTEIYSHYYKNLVKEDSCNSEISSKFPEIKSFHLIIQQNDSLQRLYIQVFENLQNHSYKNAIFFADKLITLTEGHPVIVYTLGQCYFFNEDYKKVESLFVKYKLLNFNLNFQLLAAKSLMKNKQYENCLQILELQLQYQSYLPQLEAQKWLIKAQCQEANENKVHSITCYFECLRRDPTCVEAFQRLIDCYLLNNQEKEQLITMLNFLPEDLWIKKYYLSLIKEDFLEQNQGSNKRILMEEIQLMASIQLSKHKSSPSQLQSHKQDETVMNVETQNEIRQDNLFEILIERNNIDILCIKAKNASLKYDIAKAYEICMQAIQMDPLYFEIIPIYCTCLLELNQLGELYYCAHNLVENYSNHPLSWFAIGTYYFMIKKYEIARKYFQKTNLIDRNFIYSWIGFGHSFAIQDESDQAMSVYRTCSRLFPGCYQAHLYIGMEYLRTNNLKTAQLSFNYAKEINSNDPLIFNELGVIQYKQKQYMEAKEYFLQAIKISDNASDSIIETILSNLAHTFRKLKDFKNAIQFYEKCIQLNSKSYQTYFSLAFTCHISNQLNKAISYYHKSINLKYDQQFTHDLLARCLSDAADLPWETVYNI